MRAQVFGRDVLYGPPLDALAAERVSHVRSPAALYVFDNASIDAAAAGCAGFPFDIREISAELVQQTVIGHGLVMDRRRSPMKVRARLKQVPVVVPLDVIDAVLGQHIVNGAIHMIECFRIGKVEHELVTLENRGPRRRLQHPIRVFAV